MDNADDAGQVAPTGQATPQTEAPTTEPQAGSDVGAEQTAPEGQAAAEEGLILGKFKSQEDLAKAYQELESHNKRVEMDKAELDKFVSDAYSQGTPETPEPGKEEVELSDIDKLTQALTPKLQVEMSKIMTPAIARLETQEMVRKYGESFKANAGKVAELKKGNPSLSLEDAYKLVTYDTVQRTTANQVAQKSSQTAEQKVKAQVESSRPSGIKSMTIEEAAGNPNVPMSEVLEAMGSEAAPFLNKYKELSARRKK